MQQVVPVVPRPERVEVGDGAPFGLSAATRVAVGEDPAAIGAGTLWADALCRISGQDVGLVVGHDAGRGVVDLGLDPDVPDDGSHTLEVTAQRVVVRAGGRDGLLHALATVRQLARTGPAGTAVLPPVRIADAPRYPWRGLSVDVARHFFGLPVLQVLVDLAALYKLNVLHLHLTDDQGWRLHVPSRPGLTERSSSTAVGGAPGGHLTAGEWATLVGYADARGVTVVPEIDVPGHVHAALHAYGELTPEGTPPPAYTGTDVGFSRLHDDLPATGAFLQDVFADVAAMTSGPYVHIGGDEVLTMGADEYARLVGAASAAVRAGGKDVVGWQEIARAPLAPGTIVQVWDLREDLSDVVAAAAAGARVLLSPGSRTYLDMKYDAGTPLGLEWAGHIEVRDAYDWDPDALVPGLPADAVVGVEAAIWTETITDLAGLSAMLLPRLAAVAEVAWSSQDRRGWEDFRRRLAVHPPLWRRMGLHHHASPQVDWVR